LRIEVAESPGLCELVSAAVEKGGATVATIDVYYDQTKGPLPSGAYPIASAVSASSPMPAAAVALFGVDAQCGPLVTFFRPAVSGTVTLSQVSAGEVSGSVDAILEDGTRLSGPFQAPHCAAPADAGSWTCVR
jgi:hypothetical protein